MKSALNLNEDELPVMTAEELRQITITKEELFERQKKGVIESLMSSMVKHATESGSTSYNATLNPQFDVKLLASITEVFESKGFKVTTEAKNVDKVGNVVSLTISWAE